MKGTARHMTTRDRGREEGLMPLRASGSGRKTASFMKTAAFLCLIASLSLAGLFAPAVAEATPYYFKANTCTTANTSGSLATVQLATSDSCNRTLTNTRNAGGAEVDLLLGYWDAGVNGFDRRYQVTAASTGDISFTSVAGGGTAYLKLVELSPDGSTIRNVLSTQSFTITGTAKNTFTSWTALSGTIPKGSTFGFLLSANASGDVTVTYGRGATPASIALVNATVGSYADVVQATGNTAVASGSYNEGTRDVAMQYFRLWKQTEVYTPSDPKLDKVVINGSGTEPHIDVTKVSIYQSSDTNFNAGSDTLLGEGHFNDSNVCTIDIDDPAEPTINATGFYLFVVYNIYINAGNGASIGSSVTGEASVVLKTDDYLTFSPAGPYSSSTISVTGINKDAVTIADPAVWSSGYLEQGIVNTPIMSVSLQTTTSGQNNQADLYSITIEDVGDAPVADITKVKVYFSDDATFDPASDTVINTGTSTFSASHRSVTIKATNGTFTVPATKKYLFVTYDISASAGTTGWIQPEIVNELYVEMVADVVNTFTGFVSNRLPIRPANFKVINECYECHTFPPLDSPEPVTKPRNSYSGAVVGDHERVSHVPSGSTEDACAVCHWPMPGGDMNHQDGTVDINSTIFDGGSYSKSSFTHTASTTTGYCSNTSCHGAQNLQWGIDTVSCAQCHNQNKPNASTGPRRKVIGGSGSDMEDPAILTGSRHIHNTTAYADSSCEVCHLRTTHTREGDPNVLLYNGDTGEGILYNGTGKSATPACVSCHDADGVKRLGQNADKPFFASGDNTAPANINWKPNKSAHDTAQNIATDKCMACHGNLAGSLGNTLNPKMNAHGSTQPSLLRFTYVSATSETYCYSCHGNAGGANRNIEASFGFTYNHSAGRESCILCHDPHMAEAGLHTPGAGGIAPVNKGQGWTYEYQICFAAGCHDTAQAKSGADGSSSDINADSNFTAGTIYRTNWKNMPNIQTQFSTTNLSYHPLLSQGRNQPPTGYWTGLTTTDYLKSGGVGLDHTFVDGWGTNSLVTCTDCHDNAGEGNTGARGPHGSSRHWILKGADTTVKVTTWAVGVITPNAGTSSVYEKRNFCVNCHRADVYGDGDGDAPSTSGTLFSRLDHQAGLNASCQAATQNAFACINCHGGAQVAGIHGTSLGVGTFGGDAQGKRFMNGNAWTAHGLGDASGDIGCATGSPTASGAIGTFSPSCASKHAYDTKRSAWATTLTPKYYYSWQ